MFISKCSVALKRSLRPILAMKGTALCKNGLAPTNAYISPILTRYSSSTTKNKSNYLYDSVDGVDDYTEDKRIVQLSRYVMNNELEEGMKIYSTLPLFLPRSDFKIVCSLMQQLGKRCGVPELENTFNKIQRMKLSRKHALTFRCLVRVAYEMKDADLIESFYKTICDEEVYINNAFLNDIVIDSLFSLDAYSTICHIFESIPTLTDKGAVFPLYCTHSSQCILSAFIAEGRDDLIIFFLNRVKSAWRIPAALTDYIVSNAKRNPELSQLFNMCIDSQPKSSTLFNEIIQFYIQDANAEMALQTVERAYEYSVNITVVSYIDICGLLMILKDEPSLPSKKAIETFCSRICSLDRGGYIVMMGVEPLEMMLAYGMRNYAVKYVSMLKEFENGLSRKDLLFLERIKKEYSSDTDLCKTLNELITILKSKFNI